MTRLLSVGLVVVTLGCVAVPVAAAPPPQLRGYSPAPLASAVPQTITVTGARLLPGLTPSIGTASNVTATSFRWTVTLATSGGIVLTVRNTDGKISNQLTVQVLAQPPPPPPPPPPPGPTITCPAAVSATSTTVTYPAATVSGGVAPLTAVMYRPASGSVFVVGVTTVLVDVADALGRTASCSFTVTVIGPAPPPSKILGWDPAVDSVTTGYRVFWGTSAGVYSGQATIGKVTTYQVVGLLNKTTYYFMVKALDAVGTLSNPSNEVSSTTP